ncbi:tryptophan transporter [Thermoanaerobacterium sp. RBIITD]|uniref:tryptophan transporter n=1 Tax=Thermoanaerobacterium sp. RBIITD TaxID=1550240 RepID=UPI000BB8738C|nr:tryptophan transporter [Thermoanaerobacterium sp. RBIITD]SNX53362.1 Tryptophan transporter TrpP [Thermoanaerobacterium sp. RBIITD]
MESRKTLREFILCALLMALGLVLHFITPAFMFNMRPDFMLAMLFISLMIVDDLKVDYVTAIIAGIFTAITGSMPGGQIANPIDKLVTATILILLIRLLKNRINDGILAAIVGIIGTIISGAVFLGVVSIVAGLPNNSAFTVLMLTVVLPAAAINTVVTVIGYYIVKQLSRSTSLAKK